MLETIAAQKGKLIWVAILLVAATGFYLLNGRDREVLPNRITLVCVATGKTYALAPAEVQFLPARNPETGEFTLLPVWDDNGTLRVKDRCKVAFKDSSFAALNKFVDPQSLEVRK